VVISRGELWWAELPDPVGAAPGFRRPVVVLQADIFNRSRIDTVVVAVVTSNLRLAAAPGNVLLPASESGLPRDSVINVSQLVTLDKSMLDARVGALSRSTLEATEQGVKLVLDLN